MLRQGFIPRFVHGLIEYLAAAAFIVAPFALGFDSGAATAVSIVTGVIVLVVAATTDGKTSLVNQIPVGVHVVLDFVLAVALIGAPFLFGFSGESDPTAFFIGIGVLHLLITIATRFIREEPAADSRELARPEDAAPGAGDGARAATPGAPPPPD